MNTPQKTPASGATGAGAYSVQTLRSNYDEASDPMQAILGRLDGVKSIGEGKWMACCSAHDDSNPSLSVTQGNDGRVLLYCFTGCKVEDIVAGLDLTMSDLYPSGDCQAKGVQADCAEEQGGEDTPGPLIKQLEAELAEFGQPVAMWRYHDSAGEECGLVMRWDTEKGKKIRQISLRADGKWRRKAMLEPKPLYGLPQINTLGADETVYIAEGEKSAVELAILGLASTTSSGGSQAARKTDWRPLAGRSVVIWPDNDKAGFAYADTIAGILTQLSPPASVKLLDPAELDMGSKEDAFDFVQSRVGAMMSASEIKAEIEAVALATPAHVPAVVADECWPAPLRIPSGIPDVEPFDANFLPEPFRDWVSDISERMQCPIEFPAVTAMVSFSALVGRRVGIRPKRCDDWLVIPNLWGMLIGRPSQMKSPPMKEASKPLSRLIDQADAEHAEGKQEAGQFATERKFKKSTLESTIRTKLKNDESAASEVAQLQELQESCEPVHRRYATTESTVEALAELMAKNSNGILVLRDELIGQLKYMDKEGQEHARAFFLEGWDGNGAHRSDRISRGTTSVQGVCLSMLGTIQPDVLTAYVSDAFGGSRADGLLQRFQLAVWPDDRGSWKNIDRFPDKIARERVFEVFQKIDGLDGVALGGQTDEYDEGGIPFFRFDEETQCAFDEWRTKLENDRLRGADEHPVMEAHLGKLRSLVPSLALLIHLADGQTGPIGLNAWTLATRWDRFLESHARRMYDSMLHPEVTNARHLGEHLVRGDLADGFTARDVYRKKWSAMTDKMAAVDALDVLVDLKWLDIEPSPPGGGRPTTSYRINPNISRDNL